jgi:hypothetical protein
MYFFHKERTMQNRFSLAAIVMKFIKVLVLVSLIFSCKTLKTEISMDNTDKFNN